jgi:signal transduction histidine kinase
MLGIACVYMVHLYWRHLEQDDPNRTTLVAMITIWVTTMVSDMMAALELHDGPFLIAFGYSAFMLGISSVQIRRMAGSMEAVERVTARLGELVDRRTAALRRTEIQLAHGAQMATIGTLAANLAHEINNPISYVSSNLNRVEEGWAIRDGHDEIDEMLGECQEGINRVRTIVQSLLALARRSDGVDRPVDLHGLIETTLPVVRREAGGRARLETDLSSSARVDGDPRLLGHVVLSLIMHALHAVPSGEPGRHRIGISTHDEEDLVVLSVSDTGRPLSGEEIERLLGGLLDEGPDRERPGLGLVVARQIIERHRGEIRIESDSGGNTIQVMLPAL